MALSRGNTNLGADQYVNARRTESIDSASITKLVKATTEQVFGRINILNLINQTIQTETSHQHSITMKRFYPSGPGASERANLAVTLVNQDEELMGQACFYDYPNLPEVDPGLWEEWLPTRYKNTASSGSLNSLFLHFFVARGEYSHGAAKEIINTVFTAVPEAHYVYLMVPKTAYPEAALSNVFSQVELTPECPGLDGHVLFVCRREKFVPMLHVRQARVQDHDDLTPIFDRQSDMLSNVYGDFFLAELIEAQDESMHCLVAEIDGTATGFMSLCTEVNLDLLNKCFDLGPLHGLRQPHPEDVLTLPAEPVIEEDVAPVPKPESSKSARSNVSEQPPPAEEDPGKDKGELAIQRKLSEEMLDYMSDVSGSLSTSRASSVMEKPESSLAEMAEEAGPALEKAKTEPSLPKAPNSFIPEFYGESNAFSIQLFCVDEQYEMRSLDLLREAFAKMPGKEFAVMTVPHLVPEFPLIQKFLRVTPRITSTLSQELYVFHKMGLTEDFIVRDAVRADTEGIKSLVQTLTHKDSLLQDLAQYLAARRDPDGTELRVYVAEVHQQIVGVSVIRAEQDIEYVRSHYNIEDFIYYNHHARSEHGHLHHFALNPIFDHYTKHFIKEILRKAHKTSLYYPVYPPTSSGKNASRHSMLTCMNEMVPVRPRRQIIYPLDILEDRAPSKRVLQKREPYALCHINRKLTLEPKVAINARVVVVGASTAALSYLETLAFCPHLKFNNLVLISPHGLPGELDPDPLRESLLGTDYCYSEEDYAKISLRSWVSVVYGKMTRIDRAKKQVFVNRDKIVSYDHLIIATGEQHQYPMPTGMENGATYNLPQSSPDRWFVGIPPKNLFVVNDDYDAAVSLFWTELNVINKSNKGKVVVHGINLRTYTTIQTLIQLGIAPSQIVLVKPQDTVPTVFNNDVIDHMVQANLLNDGVTIKEPAFLASWEVNEESQITELTFLTPEGPFTTPCSVGNHIYLEAFFSYTTKRVDLDAFKAVNDACLVFDGKLVIDSTFHTNDISIRSAGSMTKYQRRYHAEPWTQKNFNSKEVGLELASAMLSLFDPTLDLVTEAEEDPVKLIPLYRSPKVQSGVLPGGLNYLTIGKPSLGIPLSIHNMNPEYGTVLSTGDEKHVENYFRLHFNCYNTVETITCVSKNEIEVSNLLCLYGIHQRFLNNVMQRYKEGLITDFFSYFREAWALAIYHDRFSDFRDEIRELLVNQPAPDVRALEDKVRELIEEDLQLSEGQRKNLHDIYADTSVKRAVETRLLSYLSYNYYHLPMYAKPGMV